MKVEHDAPPEVIEALRSYLPVEQYSVWLAVPCACKMCADEDAFAQTSYFVWHELSDDVNYSAFFCIVHGLIGFPKKLPRQAITGAG